MNQSTISQITEAVHPLTQKLGQGSEIYWKAQYKQVYIDAFTVILFWGGVLLATIIIWRLVLNRLNKNKDNYDYVFQKNITHGVGIAITLLCSGLIITGGVQPLINPVQQTILNIEGQLIPAPKS